MGDDDIKITTAMLSIMFVLIIIIKNYHLDEVYLLFLSRN